MKKAAFFTLGCKVNQYETQAMTEQFIKNGYEICDFSEYADVYVVNSCTVTATGDKKSRQALRRGKKTNPDAVCVLAGCYAQHLTADEAKDLGADVVIGTGNKGQVVELVQKAMSEKTQQIKVDSLGGHRVFEETPISQFDNKTRAVVKIQDGCDRFCSYCIIPYVRGPIRSRPVDSLKREVKRLADAGFKEIVLSGIQVAAYGTDIGGITLADAIEESAKENNIERIRLSSMEVVAITDEFMKRVYNTGKLCQSFHLSLQSGCDSVLKRMNRRYDTKKYLESLELIRKYYPDAAITTDVIVGFPGETDDEFDKSLKFAEKAGFSKMHVFPYSKREGTKAALMDGQLEKHIKEERVKKMMTLDEILHERFLKSIENNTYNVLFEREVKKGIYEGYTENYIEVYKHSDTDISGKILQLSDIGKYFL